MNELRGKNAILTGASRGIGVYVAKALAAEGVNLTLAARSADKLDATRRACEAMGVRVTAVACDVTSLDDLRRLVATAEREIGQVDILVNNAGIEYTDSFANLSIEQVDELLTTNLNAPVWLTKLVLPGMLARRSGAIVNVASLAGKSPVPYNAPYSASKHALVGLTQSIEGELDGTGVKIGVVCPGFVSDAGMWADHEAGGATTGFMTRPVAPEKVAAAVLKAARKGGQHIVASGPMRPLLAAGELFPPMKNGLLKRLGVTAMFRSEAERLQQGHDRPGAAAPMKAEAPEREPVDVGG